MVGMKYGDPHKIVMELLTRNVQKELAAANPSTTAESIGHILAGIRMARLYRRDIAEPLRNTIAREYLRGILMDYPRI